MFNNNTSMTLHSLLSIVVLITFFITGCASDPYENYDPNAHKMLGKVIAKKLLSTPEADKVFEADTIAVPVPIPAGIVFINSPIGSPSRKGDPYSYQVDIENGQQIEIINYYSGFEIGDCVQIFVSPRFPVRMATGWGCKK